MKIMSRTPVCPTPIAAATPSLGAAAAPEVIDSRELFRAGNTVQIAHAGQRYQLRLTRENKLILTK
jgi:hemin uptake protein HemP